MIDKPAVLVRQSFDEDCAYHARSAVMTATGKVAVRVDATKFVAA